MAIRRGRAAGGGFLREFQEFALKGNVVDLAVAVIIGGAFGKIVTSFVEDIVMPGIVNPILSQTGADWREATVGPGIAIGRFFGAIVDFVIVAFIIFLAVRAIEHARRRLFREEEVEAAPADPVLVSQERLTTSLDRLTQTLDRRSL